MIRHWKFIKGFENYMITDQGEVFRFSKLQPSGAKNGYRTVSLSNWGVKSSISVHKIVLETFVGQRPPNHVAHHKDGNRANNKSSNLEWITRSLHGRLHPRSSGGRVNTGGITSDSPWRGSRVSSAKLTDARVRLIRMLRKFIWLDFHLDELADAFGVRESTISKVINRKAWAHVV